MKWLKLYSLATSLFASTLAFSQTPPPLERATRCMVFTAVCKTLDQSFEIKACKSPAMAQVFDLGQRTFSHEVKSLSFNEARKVVRLFNDQKRNNLPLGIVFEADLGKSNRENGHAVLDATGTKIPLTCTLPK